MKKISKRRARFQDLNWRDDRLYLRMHLIKRFAKHREWNNWIFKIYQQENSEKFDVAFIDLNKNDFEFKLSCLTIDNQFNFAIESNMSWRKSREDIHMNSSIWAMIIEKNSFLLLIRWRFIALICSKWF